MRALSLMSNDQKKCDIGQSQDTQRLGLVMDLTDAAAPALILTDPQLENMRVCISQRGQITYQVKTPSGWQAEDFYACQPAMNLFKLFHTQYHAQLPAGAPSDFIVPSLARVFIKHRITSSVKRLRGLLERCLSDASIALIHAGEHVVNQQRFQLYASLLLRRPQPDSGKTVVKVDAFSTPLIHGSYWNIFPVIATFDSACRHVSVTERVVRASRGCALQRGAVHNSYELGRRLKYGVKPPISLTDGHCFMVMRRIPGRDLCEHNLRGSLPKGRAALLHLILALISQVDRLHQLGYIHGDIKPENFVASFDQTMEVALIDLDGVSKTGSHPWHATLTPGYDAPERTRAVVNEAIDIYSLGVTITTLLSQRVAERPENLSVIVASDSFMARQSDFSSQEKKEIAALLLKTHDRTPENRPRLAELATFFTGLLCACEIKAVADDVGAASCSYVPRA